MSSLPASGNTSTTNDVDQITNDVAQIKLETKNENKNVLKSSSPSPRLHTKFTKEEMEIFSKVSKQLLKSKQNGGSGLSSNQVLAREVAMITLISKCRVDTAVKKYEHFIDTLKEYNLSIASLYEDENILREKLKTKWNKNYEVCGVDNGGRSVMWISAAEPNKISEEQTVVHAGIMYWMAVHSDIVTLRDGCTFVIDTTKQKDIPRVGNERKLQKTWQSLPLRPQNLFIVGASFVKRLFINALIKFASVFSNSKVLARLRFVEMESVREKIPSDNMPMRLGGGKHGLTVDQWVLSRLSNYDDLQIC
jgi:hypothetical protein